METMKYSDTAFPVHLDPGQIVAELHANAVDLPKRTVREHIEYALDHPIGAGPIEETVQAGDKVCILISDVTRRWQQPSAYLPILVERLNRAGIPDKDILILCATGTHRRQTEEELSRILKTDCASYTRKCSSCGRELSWDYPFSICERCFERGRTSRRGSRDGRRRPRR